MDAEKEDVGQSPEKAMVTAVAKFSVDKAKIPNPKDAEGAKYEGLKGVDNLDTVQQAVVARVMDHIASDRRIRQAVKEAEKVAQAQVQARSAMTASAGGSPSVASAPLGKSESKD